MKLHFIGTGSAFTLKNFQTSIVIQNNGKNLLVDAGTDVRFAIDKVGLSSKDIDAVYITHQHSDHCGGLEWLAFSSYFDPDRKTKIRLIAEEGLVRTLWEESLQGGLKHINDRQMNLEDYFDVTAVRLSDNDPEPSFYWSGTRFHINKLEHMNNGIQPVYSYGLTIHVSHGQYAYRRILITGDSKLSEKNNVLYENSDLIVQDCETGPFRSGVHAHFEELESLPSEIKKKMVLVHYQDNVLYPRHFYTYDGSTHFVSLIWHKKAENAGFIGFVQKGCTIDTEEWFNTQDHDLLELFDRDLINLKGNSDVIHRES
jgi:ribonuclease BN (tRNA processing enzyme)